MQLSTIRSSSKRRQGDENTSASLKTRASEKVVHSGGVLGKKKASRAPVTTSPEQTKIEIQHGQDLLAPIEDLLKQARKKVQWKAADLLSFQLYVDLLDATIQRLNGCSLSDLSEDPFIFEQMPPLVLGNDIPAGIRSDVASWFEKIEYERSQLIRRVSVALGLALGSELPGEVDVRHLLPAFHAYDFYCQDAEGFVEMSGEDFIKARESITQLCASYEILQGPIPEDILLPTLKIIFPDIALNAWTKDKRYPNADQIYGLTMKEDTYPLILVSQDEDERQAFAKNQATYMEAFSSKSLWKLRRERGAPVLFIQLSEGKMTFGAAFYASPHSPPSIQRLPGLVDLRFPSLQSGARQLWALQKCLRELVSHLTLQVRPLSLVPAVPQTNIIEAGIEVTATISPGQIYRVKVNDTSTAFKEIDQTRDYVVRAIYPRIDEHYHKDIHHTVGLGGFAPEFMGELPYSLEESIARKHNVTFAGSEVLARYMLVEQLPPPWGYRPGWKNLAELKAYHIRLAWSEKSRIEQALLNLAEWLDNHGFAFRGIQPTGILVKMKLEPSPVLEQDLSIKLVDFRVAGMGLKPWDEQPAIHWTKTDPMQTGNREAVYDFIKRWITPMPMNNSIMIFDTKDEDD
ncbi:hypothetical protein CVT26_001240 [Gymnopilus dilepis]|uniref:Uncharacterized protein n=1 Tax=Gymnopilus dilepis TaxID=231916 RepID=A0A409WBE8_9AGAR|nr:hypothetical protein CVT26_001240 [Gymnopilus dilepis]